MPILQALPRQQQSKVRFYLAIFTLLSGCWIAGEILAAIGWIDSPLVHLIHDVQFASFYLVMMFASFTLLHLGTRAPAHEWRAIAMLGPPVALGVYLLDPITQLGFTAADAVCVGFGMTSVAMLAVRACHSGGAERSRALCLYLLTCMLLVFTVLNPFFQDLTNRLTPTTLDSYAYVADEALGMQWSFVLGQLFETLPTLRTSSAVVYYTLLFAFLVVLVLQQRRLQPPHLDIFPTLLGTTLLGYSIYLLFPLVGPAALFGQAYPFSPPAAAVVLSGPLEFPDAPRNCMPSLHTVWALLIWWHCRPFRWPIRAFAGIYLVFTLLATLGFGFHYLVDLIVAVPFAVLVQAQATPRSPETAQVRSRAMWSGGSLVVAWLIAIRYGASVLALSPALGLGAAVATVIVAWIAEARVYRAHTSNAMAKDEGLELIGPGGTEYVEFGQAPLTNESSRAAITDFA